MDDQIKLHADRAMTELDLACAARCPAAARAHLALSALHLDRLHLLSDRRAVQPRQKAEALFAG